MRNRPILYFLALTVSLGQAFASESQEQSYVLRMQQVLKDAMKLSDNQGHSYTIGGSLPFAGTAMNLDVINLDGSIAFFCSAAASLRIQNNASVSAQISKSFNNGCHVANRYAGYSISISAGSGLDVGAGLGVAGSVSYGLNFPLLIDTIRTHFIDNPWELLKLLNEMSEFSLCLKNSEVAAVMEGFLAVTAKAIEVNLSLIENSSVRAEVQDALRDLLDKFRRGRLGVKKYGEETDCGFRKISQNLSENSKAIIDSLKKTMTNSPNPAALIPNKEQLALLVESVVDGKYFPQLRMILLELLRRDLTNCNSVSFAGNARLGTPSLLSLSLSASLVHYNRIGPVIPLRSFRENIVDRYVSKDGPMNYLNDSVSAVKQVCKAGVCTWKATRDAIANPEAAVNKVKKYEADALAGFLNGLKVCTADNYKSLLVEPFSMLLAPGDKHD
jgi:hypothetical protein